MDNYNAVAGVWQYFLAAPRYIAGGKQMPELVWNGKEAAVKAAGAVPYRLLVEDRELSFGVDAES